MIKPQIESPPVAATTKGAGNAVEAIAGARYDLGGAAGKPTEPSAFAHSAGGGASLMEQGKYRRRASEAAPAAPGLPDGYCSPPVWTLKRPGGVLIAGEREYKGSRFFELRLWAGEGDKPTRKGITIPCDAVAGLAEALVAYAATHG